MSRIVRTIGAAVAGLALVGAVQGPARAAGTAEAVPSCVEAKDAYLIAVYVNITNNCTTTQQVKVEYKYDRNRPPFIYDTCYTVEPGQKVTATLPWWLGERYSRLHPC
jgi:hypothetical protein